MKRLVVLAGVISALAASLPAQAQPDERPGRFERIQQRDAQQQREFRREQELQRRQLQRHEHESSRADDAGGAPAAAPRYPRARP